MKNNVHLKYVTISLCIVFGAIIVSCSNRKSVLVNQTQRLDLYVNSDNEYIAEMFPDDNLLGYFKQPALTNKELYILDALVDRIDPEVRRIFDQKYNLWLTCWAPYFSTHEENTCVRQSLKCNGEEFKELIEYCREQNDDIFLLLYQLAVRANCPFDQLLLHPAYDLLDDFPEFSQYWQEVELSLQRKNPDFSDRTCNESTIWQVRKILDARYGFSHSNGLTAMFDANRMIQMTQ